MITITASPRLYWLRMSEEREPVVEVITEGGRYPLDLYPHLCESHQMEYLWGKKGAGTKILALAILWDMFRSRETCEAYYLRFSSEVLEDVRAGVANVLSSDMVTDWLLTERIGRMSAAQVQNCGGCGQ